MSRGLADLRDDDVRLIIVDFAWLADSQRESQILSSDIEQPAAQIKTVIAVDQEALEIWKNRQILDNTSVCLLHPAPVLRHSRQTRGADPLGSKRRKLSGFEDHTFAAQQIVIDAGRIGLPIRRERQQRVAVVGHRAGAVDIDIGMPESIECAIYPGHILRLHLHLRLRTDRQQSQRQSCEQRLAYMPGWTARNGKRARSRHEKPFRQKETEPRYRRVVAPRWHRAR